MQRPGRRVAAIGVGALLVGGVAIAGIAAAGRTVAAEEAAAGSASTATAPVVRRVIQSSDLLDGTLGYAGAYTITNWLETTADGAGGSSSSPDQAYLAAKAQYDTAVANRSLLRNPTKADITRARATLAQARAALRTAQQADDGPTAAQRAAARSAVTQAEANLATAVGERDAAETALADCSAATDGAPDASTSGAPGCDAEALAAAVDRAASDVTVRRAQLKAAEAALAGLNDTPPNAAANVASARAGVTAADAALDALLDPTAAKVRLADDAVATAGAQLEDARRGAGLPGGIVTMVPEVGSVVEPGEVLYALDGTHAVVLLAGDIPAWRTLGPDAADGPDIGQLERTLEALGHGFENVRADSHWDDDTTDAVLALQAAIGTAKDGILDLGEVAFAPAAIRVTGVLADLGSTVRRGARVMTASSTEREVAVELEADRQSIVAIGAGVTVGLPDGTETAGTITDIATVATVATGANGAADAAPTVTVTIHLDDPRASATLDGAPVTVGVVRERRADVLAVPVSALLALAEGGYAVEVVDDRGGMRLVGVETGLFEDGFVEVRSTELEETMRVVVPS
jgi:multidrug efflux pump subunit AcrA (membrane-fusion protein)